MSYLLTSAGLLARTMWVAPFSEIPIDPFGTIRECKITESLFERGCRLNECVALWLLKKSLSSENPKNGG